MKNKSNIYWIISNFYIVNLNGIAFGNLCWFLNFIQINLSKTFIVLIKLETV